MSRESFNLPPVRPGASAPLSLNISGPSLDRASYHLSSEITHEIEAKYYIPKEVLTPLIKGRGFIQIEQRYFPDNRVRAIVEEFKDELKITDPEAFSSARIRRSRSPHGNITYCIECKGRKEGEFDLRISRRESTAKISRETYKKLKEQTTAGILRKRRYPVRGTVESESGPIPVTAHVDVLQAAGKKIRKLKKPVATVDIELSRAEDIRHLRAGSHSFKFLGHCIELTAKAPREQKILATRLIAKKGLREEQTDFLKKLAREAKDLRKKPER